MTRWRCNACKGVYSDILPGGYSYAHACGPLAAAKKLPERERPNKRDENVLADRDGKVLGIRSEGAGVTCLTDDKLDEPKWITKLKKVIAAREEKENA